jgi:prepilin-type N-terminal cleavage/methylation domain-containing protein
MKAINKNLKAGFSLVELLVVIAVIGLIAAIAIPQISKITDKARKASAQRNAQNVVSTYGAAIAAGAAITGTTPTAIVDSLETGVTGAGSFSDSFFKISTMAALDQTDAEAFLAWDGTNSVLTYNATATFPPTP